jgi:hypothetical protein
MIAGKKAPISKICFYSTLQDAGLTISEHRIVVRSAPSALRIWPGCQSREL